MVRGHVPTYCSVTRTAEAVGPQLGISGNSLRRWVQAMIQWGPRLHRRPSQAIPGQARVLQ